ncbi:GSCOCG00003785001-RA-CDS [Cotesia congregata]|uniref:Similar to GPR158: Probable G-protein coupled receptor 158 (Bos taurus) n=1 Tax=Cotesia congregata TaxID=51543 RepID=A0A8J2HQI9_COTCN|nr:GSCOCG00003785001-RA-CDS [Cotesia congregata]CAG5107280.1 Similar to GPR158: Probable G-protein coupled receptor 158 (Bos taurus) [Cotesia congregata]
MVRLALTVSYVLACFKLGVVGQFEWQPIDHFDEIQARVNLVNKDNCQIKRDNDLYLPPDSVSHLPNIKDININPVFPNRTGLLYIHNLAISRAYFWSYSLQSRFIRPALNDTYDPGMMYYFLSSVADVSSNPHVNASATYFAPNMSFTPSYRGFFNKTLPRFAPRVIRADDFNDPVHMERISTRNTFTADDLGAFAPSSFSLDYTNALYRINKWYSAWLPDVNPQKRHDTKTTYQVEIRYANNTNETYSFHGPPGADENPGPVKWTEPYFDCDRSNRWLVAAVVPIADIYPRHTAFRHIEYPTYTAVSVIEMEYERIDINQCPKSDGNNGPNHFSNTAKCKNETTECEPLHGWGSGRRGAYQCRCRPGYRLPSQVRRPYLGEIIERATDEQYHNGFDCVPIGYRQVLPIEWHKAPKYLRDKYLEKYPEYVNSTVGPESFQTPKINIHNVLTFMRSVNGHNCKLYTKADLTLHGDVGYGSTEFFENQARMATRLANFISAFLQLNNPKEVYSGKRVPDKELTEDQMMGETLALLLGDTKIWAAGTYWDRNKFTNRTFFAPYAHKPQLNTRKYYIEDIARLNATGEVYTNKPWFKFLQQRWATNFDELEKYYLKLHIRFNETGEYHKKFEQYPTSYRAANLNHGHWTTPYFDCNGKVNKWVITYASPFFGWDSLRLKLEFKGVVAVTMNLMDMDINQCDDKFYVPNAFKGTHKCDRKTSYCVPIFGRGFDLGGYKCECKQGFEYPLEDPTTYIDGQIMEAEFQNIIEDKKTRIGLFKCRLAGASAAQASYTLVILMAMFFIFRVAQR